MEFDDWQKEIINYNGDIVVCSGRQTGKSMTIAEKCKKTMVERPNTSIIVVSVTEDQAELMIIKILESLEKSNKSWICKGAKKPTKSLIRLNNGSSVRSRACGNTGDSLRGFTGDVLVIDEVAFMPPQLFAAVTPILLSTGGQLWLTSTPKGKQGFFWDCYQNKSGRFKVFHINTEEVINNRPISATWTEERRKAAIKFLENEKKDKSNLEYAQEYMGLFIDDLSRLIPDKIIMEMCILKRRPSMQGNYFLGVDVARLGEDKTSYQIIEKLGKDRYEHRESFQTQNKLLTETADKIIHLNRLYSFNQIGIDTNGVGAGVFDILLRVDEVKRRIVSIENQERSIEYDSEKDPKGKKLLKEDMYLNLLSMLEKKQLYLLDDPDIIQSLMSIQYEYVKKEGQKTRLRVFCNPHSASHNAEALIRATHLAKEKNLSIWISSF